MSNIESESALIKEEILDIFEPSTEVVHTVDKIVYDIELEARTVGRERYLQSLYDTIIRDPETGVKCSVFTDNNEPNSDVEAVLVPGPFATDLKTMVVIGEMIRRIVKAADIRDKNERLLPVVMYSAPVADAGIRLNRTQRIQVESGDFRPVAEKYLQT